MVVLLIVGVVLWVCMYVWLFMFLSWKMIEVLLVDRKENLFSKI